MVMHPNETTLNDYIDEALAAAERADVDRHLATCAACRQTVDDLRQILRATAELEPREPPVRSWSRLERAIKMEREHAAPAAPTAGAQGFSLDGARASQPSTGTARLTGSRSAWLAGLAAAAALVLATLVGVRYMPARHTDAPAGSGAPVAPGEAAQSIETELRQAEAHYENAIKGLESIASSEQSELDPRTAATLQKNLAVIDQAISESRAAVRAQPANEPAQQSLIDGFKTKIGLLQDTVALINEMRKGNEAGAARIASGLKQKGT
jgi:anti-sigma factor ChrR (cupin superfamily)